MEDIDKYIKELSKKYYKEVKHLTREQFKIALEQAMKSGDFIRATMLKHSPLSSRQGVYYIPYNLKLDLDIANKRIKELKAVLQEIMETTMEENTCSRAKEALDSQSDGECK